MLLRFAFLLLSLILSVWCCLVFPHFLLLFTCAKTKVDQSKATQVESYARDTLSRLPKGAVLLVQDDVFINAFEYAQQVLSHRLDVRVLDLNKLDKRWYVAMKAANMRDIVFPSNFSLASFFSANLESTKIFAVPELPAS